MKLANSKSVFALYILFCLLVTACQKEADEQQPTGDAGEILLPVKIFSQNTGDSAVYLYDDENHLIEEKAFSDGDMSKRVFSYQNGEPLKVEEYETFPGEVTETRTYSKITDGKILESYYYYMTDGSPILSKRYYFYNNAGQLIKGEWEDGTLFQELTWNAEGLATTMWYKESSDLSYQYTYDDKKGLFSAVNNPFLFDAFLNTFALNFNKKNLLESTESYVNANGEEKVNKITYSYLYNDEGYPIQLRQTLNGDETIFLVEYRKAK